MANTSVKSKCRHSNVEVLACRTRKINTIFTAAVAVLVPKYIYGQYLCEKANAGTAMWKLWRAGFEK